MARLGHETNLERPRRPWRGKGKRKTFLMKNKSLQILFEQIDWAITRWMARYGLTILRIGLGLIFFWFGALKLVPGLSPAEELVRSTTYFGQNIRPVDDLCA